MRDKPAGTIRIVASDFAIDCVLWPKLKKFLTKYPDIKLEISGHTSSEGDAEHNKKLSQDRADAVKAYMVGKGIDEKRVQTRGAGSSEPVADEKQAGGLEKNRRIEFKVLPQ